MSQVSEQPISPVLATSLLGAGLLCAWWLGRDNTFPLSWPTKNPVVTSKFGMRTHPVTKVSTLHTGVDLRSAIGDPVTAPADGTIEAIYQNAAGGNQMILLHPNGYRTGYAHLFGPAGAVGQRVKRGDLIAYSGNTGKTTGPHLHFSLSGPDRKVIDPLPYFT